MGQNIAFKQGHSKAHTGLSVIRIIRAFLCDVVQRILPRPNRLCFFKRRPEHIYHVSVVLIVDHQILDCFIRDDIQGPQQDSHWDVLSDHRDRGLDGLALET